MKPRPSLNDLNFAEDGVDIGRENMEFLQEYLKKALPPATGDHERARDTPGVDVPAHGL